MKLYLKNKILQKYYNNIKFILQSENYVDFNPKKR